jgi:hypothetical protein
MIQLVGALMAASKLRQETVLFDGTITDLRISASDGTALLDNCAAISGFGNGRSWITITDSAGKKLEGYIKLKGTGEVLEDEIGGIS